MTGSMLQKAIGAVVVDVAVLIVRGLAVPAPKEVPAKEQIEKAGLSPRLASPPAGARSAGSRLGRRLRGRQRDIGPN
jgi:hypothetical protein